jgi:hypothetical protein
MHAIKLHATTHPFVHARTTRRTCVASVLTALKSSSDSVQSATSKLAAMRAGLTLLGSTLVPRCTAQRMSTWLGGMGGACGVGVWGARASVNALELAGC